MLTPAAPRPLLAETTWAPIHRPPSAGQARPQTSHHRAAIASAVIVVSRRRLRSQRPAAADQAEEKEKSIEEKFSDFTTVLPWFGFAADIQNLHSKRRAQAREASATPDIEADAASLREALQGAIDGGNCSEEMPQVVEAALRYAEANHAETNPTKVIESIAGRWEAVWSGAFTPLQKWGVPPQCLWLEVIPGEGDRPPVVSAHSGLPLALFGAYLWTSCAGDLLPAERTAEGSSQVLIQFTRYWIDIGPKPRPDIGRIDGGFISSRLAAFGAALVTPVLLEFGALKWLLERFGLERVFEVEVPSPDGSDKKIKLQASLELYLTLLARVAFPDSLSTCPVPFLDTKAGLCVYEIPMLGPLGDLPDWLHPGGNSAALVARRLKPNEEPVLMRR